MLCRTATIFVERQLGSFAVALPIGNTQKECYGRPIWIIEWEHSDAPVVGVKSNPTVCSVIGAVHRLPRCLALPVLGRCLLE